MARTSGTISDAHVLAQVPATVWACGPDGGVTFVNQHGLDFVGTTLEAALGRGWADYAHPEDRPRVDARYLEAFEARRPFELEYRLRRHDGVYREVLARGVPSFDERGEFTGYVGSSSDVTPVREAERKVQRGLELFQSTLDGLGCQIAVLDREGRIRLVNEAWRRFGAEAGAALSGSGLGASYLEVCDRSRGEDAEVAARVAAGIRDLLAGQRDGFELEYPCRTAREDRWFVVQATPLRGNADAAVVVAHTEVTALRRAEYERSLYERRVRESQRLESLGVLAGGIAHDFNNLLTVVLGNTRLAAEELGCGSPARPRLERVRDAAEQASRLTEQMLTYAGKGQLELETLGLSRTLREMRPLLEACLEGRTLELRLDDELPPVQADAGQLRQVVLNLLLNAAESMDGDGAVTLRTRALELDEAALAESVGAPELAPGRYVALEVTDRGPGIEPEARGRLFEPLFQQQGSGPGARPRRGAGDPARPRGRGAGGVGAGPGRDLPGAAADLGAAGPGGPGPRPAPTGRGRPPRSAPGSRGGRRRRGAGGGRGLPRA